MQRIDKTDILATAYIDWLHTLSGDHPKYDSSNGKYYYDIIANLIWIQKGLCAYTERMLIDSSVFSKEKREYGKNHKFKFSGELDHYYPNSVEKHRWSWDNFFLIDSDVNSKKVKGSNIPKGILKPDREDFDPFFFLEYDFKEHRFLPNQEREYLLKKDILVDIETLGLNFKPILDTRKKYLSIIVSDVKFGVKTKELAIKELYQFYTAFEMSMHQINLEDL